MGKKIIVAGGGHGGITAAAQLAKAGFDVTVYERHTRENMGWDWFDAIDPRIFGMVGCPHPEEVGLPWTYRADILFGGHSTDDEHMILQEFDKQEELEIIMERKDLYKLIIGYAEKCGVKFEFGTSIKGPVMAGDRVIGISTDKGDFLADLVIDAAGFDSPVRLNLPKCLGIQGEVPWGECVYTYRAFYDLPIPRDQVAKRDTYKCWFFPDDGEFSFSWVYTQDDYTDILIAHYDKLTMDEVNKLLPIYQEKNPQLGKNKLRGGQIVHMPLRRPLSVLVADGYAAIGDAAFMIMPLNGSGISISFEISKLLAYAIIADKTETYSAETLWKYQRDFMKHKGRNLAPVSLVTGMITDLTPELVDYAFDTGVITQKELNVVAGQDSFFQFLHYDSNLPARAKLIYQNKPLLKAFAMMVMNVVLSYIHSFFLPKEYSRAKVIAWAKKYDKLFTYNRKKKK